MIEEAAAVIEASQAALWHGFGVFLRIGAVMAVLPAFGEQTVPLRVKLALTMAFTLIVAASLPPPGGVDAWSLPALVRLVATEPVNGLILGIGFRLFVLALQTAGAIAAQATSLSQTLGGAGVDPMPAIGQILVVAGLALAVMQGLHVRVAEVMIRSYSLLPAGRFPDPADVSGWGVAQVARSFALAFTLAAPFVIVSVLYNLTLGVINRAMPQLMVAFVGAPVITLGGLALLLMVSPLMLNVWVEALNGFAGNPFGPVP